MSKVMVEQSDIAAVAKEADLMAKTIGEFKTGDQFLECCRSIYNDTGKIKAIGLAFNRLRKNLADLQAASVEPKPAPPSVSTGEFPIMGGYTEGTTTPIAEQPLTEAKEPTV